MKTVRIALNLLAVYAGHLAAADLWFFILRWRNADWAYRLSGLDFIFPFPVEWMLMKEFLCDTGSGSGLKRTIVFTGVLVLFLTDIAGMISLMIYVLFIEDSAWKGFCYSFIFTVFLLILITILAVITGSRESEEIIINELRPYSR